MHKHPQFIQRAFRLYLSILCFLHIVIFAASSVVFLASRVSERQQRRRWLFHPFLSTALPPPLYRQRESKARDKLDRCQARVAFHAQINHRSTGFSSRVRENAYAVICRWANRRAIFPLSFVFGRSSHVMRIYGY